MHHADPIIPDKLLEYFFNNLNQAPTFVEVLAAHKPVAQLTFSEHGNLEKCWDQHQDLFIAFVDHSKAFYTEEMPLKYGFPGKFVTIFHQFYVESWLMLSWKVKNRSDVSVELQNPNHPACLQVLKAVPSFQYLGNDRSENCSKDLEIWHRKASANFWKNLLHTKNPVYQAVCVPTLFYSVGHLQRAVFREVPYKHIMEVSWCTQHWNQIKGFTTVVQD